MGSRLIPFDPEAICDGCGAQGAYDFMGDLLCADCSSEIECEDEEED